MAGFSFSKVIIHTRPLRMVLPWIRNMERRNKSRRSIIIGWEDGRVVDIAGAYRIIRSLIIFVFIALFWARSFAAEPDIIIDKNKDQATTEYVIDLPAQEVAKSLNVLAVQTGAQFLFSYDLVENRTANPVRGNYTLPDAVEQMLDGTGLKSGFDEGVLSISRMGNIGEPDNPNFKGRDEVKVNKNLLTSVLAVLLGSGATQVQAQSADVDTVVDVDTIMVLGTRGKPRSVTDSPVPADVFTADDLERRANDGLIDSLNYLTPSYNAPTRAGGGTASIIATGALRGLNPDHTLVLVNGKRRHKSSLIMAVSSLYNGSAPVDLDMIPLSAIKSVEVLRDGAAAQYGSDAIAGVININLKDASDGGSASATYSENFDRGDGTRYLFTGNLGFELGDQGFINLSTVYKDQNDSNRAVLIDPSIRLFPDFMGGVDPREGTIDRLVTKNFGRFPQETLNLSFNAGYEIEETELYMFGTFSDRTSHLNFTYREPNDNNAVTEIFPFGFRPAVLIEETDFEVAAGVRGEVSGWDYDASFNLGKANAHQSVSNTVNASLGRLSPTSFEIGDLISSEWVAQLDLTRSYDFRGGELQTSFGALYRSENYRLVAGDPSSYQAGTAGLTTASPGSQGGQGIRPSNETDTTRGNFAVYGELGYDISDRAFISAAGRFESYDDDSGETLTGKLAGRYEFADWISARSAVSTGFRAPGLAQSAFSATTSQFRTISAVQELFLIRTLPPTSDEAKAFGATPLTPEKSFNLSLGLVLTPTDNFTLTIDAYQINLDDRIASTSTIPTAALEAVQFYTNAIDTRTRGIDIVATLKQDLDTFGQFTWILGYNYNETIIQALAPTPDELMGIPLVNGLFDRSRQGSLTAVPSPKINLGLNWDLDNLSVNAKLTRFGGTSSIHRSNPDFDLFAGSKWIADLEVAYLFDDTYRLAVGANNLFNTYPDEIRDPIPIRGAFQYDTTSPFGFTGGSYYARLSVKF